MDDQEAKLKILEEIHQSYERELGQLESSERETVRAFLEGVRNKKIEELKNSIMNINKAPTL